MKILGFAGSNSMASINKKLVGYVLTYFKEDEIDLVDLNDFEMPIYSADRENKYGIPQLAFDFAAKIDQSDLLIVSLAEHNGAYSTGFKNIFDWVSRIAGRKAFGDKPILLMAGSPGPRGGASVLEIANNRFPRSGGKVLETFSMPSFGLNFENTRGIINLEIKLDLENKIQSVKNQMNIER